MQSDTRESIGKPPDKGFAHDRQFLIRNRNRHSLRDVPVQRDPVHRILSTRQHAAQRASQSPQTNRRTVRRHEKRKENTDRTSRGNNRRAYSRTATDGQGGGSGERSLSLAICILHGLFALGSRNDLSDTEILPIDIAEPERRRTESQEKRSSKPTFSGKCRIKTSGCQAIPGTRYRIVMFIRMFKKRRKASRKSDEHSVLPLFPPTNLKLLT